MMDSKSFPMGTVRILDQLIKRNLKEDNLKIVMGDFISPLYPPILAITRYTIH